MGKINGFSGDYTGLNNAQVQDGLLRYGKNELVPEKRLSFLHKVIDIFKEPMFLLLFGTALLYFLLGEPRDGIIMLAFVSFMAGITLFQEWRTDKTLQALKDLSSPQVRVIRNGVIENIDSRELTVGDLMLFEEGERIAADGRVTEMFDLGIDESTLTGESEIVWKKIYPGEEETNAHWRRDCCYAGTAVTQGSAIVTVTATGANTAYGKIGIAVYSAPDRPTPLEKQTRHLIKVAAIAGLIMIILVFLLTLAHEGKIIDSLLSGITLAMAMIPEEFPVILTVFLAMGAWRLARKNSLVRKMPAIETLGAVSVLCVDKTGTLTQNQMALQEVRNFNGITEKEVFFCAALACETVPYDPMEKAILAAAAGAGFDKQELFNKKLILEYPFRSETRMMGHVWEIDGAPYLFAKGSPESLLPLCRLGTDATAAVEKQQEELAAKGYRVLAVARRTGMTSLPEKLKDNELELVGLLGLEDPPRKAVPPAVAICTGAGIRVVMITGDNGVTAKSIAGKIGIVNSDRVITGHELDAMSDIQLREELKTVNIFARVVPSHKMRIVKAFRDIGEIVAMTGDGVNDAPALKYADIGIAMGKRGTGVAKEAADMVLLDDNFTTIVDTIRDGRRIYDNIKKAIGYVLVIHIPIALTALLTPLLQLHSTLLLPIHVVMLEMIVDPTCSIIFERQPAECDLMNRKPRKQNDRLVSPGLIAKAVLQGLVILVATFGSYLWLLRDGWTEETARTFALVVLIFANLALVYVNQSKHDFAITAVFRTKDKVMLYVNGAILLALLFIVYTQFGNDIAKTAPLTLRQAAAAAGLAFFATFWWDAVKLFQKMVYRITLSRSQTE